MKRKMFICEYCKKEIKNDIAHVNNDKMYHLSCYRKHLHGHDDDKHELYECPRCHTLGRRWNGEKEGWKPCKMCKGSGYISVNL